MEQGRTEEGTSEQQDQQQRRLKPSENPLNHLPQQPQKCPRCDSLNTKFCYFNNYSLTQPRYFCKTCRRYWTQGGTLRNVPVGGGCRKGKRTKSSSSSGGENSRTQSPPPPPPPQQHIQVPSNLTTMHMATMLPGSSSLPTNQAFRNKELGKLGLPPAIPPMSSYNSGGGFLSSLAAMQGLDQTLNFGGQFGAGASNWALLQGLNVPSWRSQQVHSQQIEQERDYYQMGNREKNTDPMYPSDQLVQPSRTMGSWTHSFINTTNPSGSEPNFWNNTTSHTTSTSSATNTGSSMNPNQWPDLPGYGGPP
ncbi:unnamed protein product [Ilex paraguariensis]|uniref:Dof zinc finger protein n=1 Tax=Ilex paraguariensis TaxID=185542 RepID=A0ABC8ULU8_9AQUA